MNSFNKITNLEDIEFVKLFYFEEYAKFKDKINYNIDYAIDIVNTIPLNSLDIENGEAYITSEYDFYSEANKILFLKHYFMSNN